MPGTEPAPPALNVAEPLPIPAPDILLAVCSAREGRLNSNEAWTETFGDAGLWDLLPPEDARFATEYVAEAAQGSLVANQLFVVQRGEGETPLPVLLHFLPIRLPEAAESANTVAITGEVLREPGTWAQDQTRRRRTEMLGQMAMGIAHDFNNLLTSVLGHVELLRGLLDGAIIERVLKEESSTHLRTIERAATDGATLVRKIQGYIRHEKEQTFAHVDLCSLTQEVIALTRPYWYNEPRRQGIEIEVVEELEPVPPIMGFAPGLREVLVNIVLNAAQAMPEGGRLHFHTWHDPARGVSISVSDTGVGMPAHVRSRIFEPMYTTKGDGGSGMGLAVAHGIVHEHSGEVLVESNPGKGTRFTLLFPVSTEEPASAISESQARPRDGAASAQVRILIVDDEPMVRSVTARLLALRGHEVREAVDGLAALEEVANAPFDLVITDLSMPAMNGRELAYRLRQHHPRLPIILLTGDTDASDSTEYIDAVVKKPFKLDALESTIQAVLNRRA
ncbi:hypothetical protein BH23BAC4_BH23BAC4_09180 [soil metagenome]